MTDKKHIPNGAFQVARKLFESELWAEKPASWTKIWLYILGRVNHTSNKKFKEGEGFFNFTAERKMIGKDITEDMIKKFLIYARSKHFIITHRSTRGTIVLVNKYRLYQDLSNYEARKKRELKHERSTTICKNVKNDKNISDKSDTSFKTKSKTNLPLQESKTPKGKTTKKLSARLVDTLLQVKKLKSPDGDYSRDNIFPARSLSKKLGELIKERTGKEATDDDKIARFKYIINHLADFDNKNATKISYFTRNWNRIIINLKDN